MKNYCLKIGLLFLLSAYFGLYAQEIQRKPAVAGSFYPADATSLKNQLSQFFNNIEDKTTNNNLAAIIVPHAGYIYSGEVAASGYAKLNPDKTYSRIFIIGTSHHVLLNGASVYNQGNYQTPLGTVAVDTELANMFIEKYPLFNYVPEAHAEEHSIEVQLPFLQYRLNKFFKIVPIIIGSQSAETCRKMAEILSNYFTPENLFVVSSDFSHYPSYNEALKTDQKTGQAISTNSPDIFIESLVSNGKKNIPGLATSCCGWSSVLTLLNITAQQPNIQVEHVCYRNSGDSPYGDKLRVVGYHSFVFSRIVEQVGSTEYRLMTEEKKNLLIIARETIEAQLKNKKLPEVKEQGLNDNLKTRCGAFVTLNSQDKLRGCIGRFTSNQPLYNVVQDMALAAAFHDKRFAPVTQAEIKNIDIEISVLTPLKQIYSINDFTLGKHGIYIVKGNRSGTFLPKVAESTGWTKEEFLGYCARDKAGIGWEGWKEANLYIYEALVFDEKEFLSHRK